MLGEHARTLGAVDALLLACFHRAVHFAYTGDRAIWLYDIHLLAGQLTAVEFGEFIDVASCIEIEALCCHALTAACAWFGTSLPPAVVARLAQPPVDEPTLHFLGASREAGIRGHALVELQADKTWSGRARYIVQRVFPPVSFMMRHYRLRSRALLPAYYLYRLLYGAYIFIRISR